MGGFFGPGPGRGGIGGIWWIVILILFLIFFVDP